MNIEMEYIKAQLQRRAGERQLSAVARGSGVNLRTLQRLARGQQGTIGNASKVQVYLQGTERLKRLET